jgi:hypothetical protein
MDTGVSMASCLGNCLNSGDHCGGGGGAGGKDCEGLLAELLSEGLKGLRFLLLLPPLEEEEELLLISRRLLIALIFM